MRFSSLDQQKDAADVDIKHRVESLYWYLRQAWESSNSSGIVDNDVDSPAREAS
jgi:hypothetical protein